MCLSCLELGFRSNFFRSHFPFKPVSVDIPKALLIFLIMRRLWNLSLNFLIVFQTWKAAVQPQSCCQQEKQCPPVLSADLHRSFFTGFIKLVSKLWASFLDFEIVPLPEWQRANTPQETTEVCFSCQPQKCLCFWWRTKTVFVGFQSASLETYCWPHWFLHSS